MGESAIQTDDLGKRYAERWAIRHLSFDVAYGEIVGLLGPNGAGKTTTVRLLTGQITPTEGRARVDGVDAATGGAALGRRIGVTFEQQNLYERLTVLENLAFFARLGGLTDARARDVLQEARLDDRADDVVGTLSKGLRQRLMLARALLGRPRVLFLDEPTSGLDPHAADLLHGWVRRIAQEGAAVLITTHDMREAETLCSRVAIVDRGALVALETPRALIERVHPPRLRVRLGKGEVGEERVLDGLPGQNARALAELAATHEVSEIREERATLGEAFLSLTGRSLDA